MEDAVLDRNQGRAMAEDKYARESKSQASAEEAKEIRNGQRWNVGYDKLVISVGYYNQTFGTKGVEVHAYLLKDIADARRIRKGYRSSSSLYLAHQKRRNEEKNPRVRSGWGGPVGMEFAAELTDLIHEDLPKIYPNLVSTVDLIVFDVAPRVLSMFDKSLGDYAMKVYTCEGIEIKTYEVR